MARKNALITSTIDADAQTLTIATRGLPTLTVAYGNLADNIKVYSALHGLKQRIVDAAAQSRDPDTGQPAPLAAKHAAMAVLAAHYDGGADVWALVGGGGGGGGEGSLVIRALADVQGTDPVSMRERVEALAEKRGLTVKGLLARLAKQPAVAAKMAELRPAPEIDVEEYLDDLKAM